jgi:putative CocE/NonD family hydrolase
MSKEWRFCIQSITGEKSKPRKAPFIALLLLLSVAGGGVVRAAEVSGVTVERAVPAKMRDGTVLRADIYRPSRSGQFPVLLQRTPYNKDGGTTFGIEAAKRGYIAVIQDVRGRFSSEGAWYPFKYESQDGFDTVEWAAALPGSNGKVGMFGGSYVGATQMLTAIVHPPHLAGICPVVTASNYHDGWTYQGGAFEQWFNESWTSGLAQNTLDRIVSENTNAMENVNTLPLADYRVFNIKERQLGADLTASLAPYFADWLAHPSYDDFWKQWSIEEHYPDIAVPALTVAAWYDIFQGGSLRNYLGLKQRAGNEAARRGQHLLVMIGGHAGSGRKIGDLDFGPAAAEFDENQVTLNWYDYLFKGVHNDFANGKRVKIFVMGKNQWRFEDDWPLSRAHTTKYFLHSTGKANSLRGDGSLTSQAPAGESPDRYTYDPANPAPTTGGPLCCDPKHLPAGPRDQRPVEARDDVLVYSSSALTEDTEVTGPIRLALYAKSSAVDTDFTAKLVDVWPNGYAQNLTEGIVRARYRDSQTAPELINPDQIYQFAIDLWSTSNVFRKGHRIRLEVSSSNFPRFDRNLNTGKEARNAKQFVSATNTIYHDASHPSAVVLPIVPQS